MTYLYRLQPGQRFRLAQTPDLILGELVYCNDCRAVVKLDRPAKVCDFETADGNHVHFVRASGRLTSWSRFAPVYLER